MASATNSVLGKRSRSVWDVSVRESHPRVFFKELQQLCKCLSVYNGHLLEMSRTGLASVYSKWSLKDLVSQYVETVEVEESVLHVPVKCTIYKPHYPLEVNCATLMMKPSSHGQYWHIHDGCLAWPVSVGPTSIYLLQQFVEFHVVMSDYGVLPVDIVLEVSEALTGVRALPDPSLRHWAV